MWCVCVRFVTAVTVEAAWYIHSQPASQPASQYVRFDYFGNFIKCVTCVYIDSIDGSVTAVRLPIPKPMCLFWAEIRLIFPMAYFINLCMQHM